MQLNANQIFLFLCVFMAKENPVPRKIRKRNKKACHFGRQDVVMLGVKEIISNIKCKNILIKYVFQTEHQVLN